MFKEDLMLLADKIAADNLEDAELFVKEMHDKYNDQPIAHARIHLVWANLSRLRNDYLSALGHIAAAIIFAIPVSLFKKFNS